MIFFPSTLNFKCFTHVNRGLVSQQSGGSLRIIYHDAYMLNASKAGNQTSRYHKLTLRPANHVIFHAEDYRNMEAARKVINGTWECWRDFPSPLETAWDLCTESPGTSTQKHKNMNMKEKTSVQRYTKYFQMRLLKKSRWITNTYVTI